MVCRCDLRLLVIVEQRINRNTAFRDDGRQRVVLLERPKVFSWRRWGALGASEA